MFILLAYVSQVIYYINTLTSDKMFIKDLNIFTLDIFITSTSDINSFLTKKDIYSTMGSLQHWVRFGEEF